MKKPLLEIVAGPNGSGKSTFAESFLVKLKLRENYLNPDLIANAVSPGANGAGLFAAGRILLRQVDEHIQSKSDFAFESTLSGKTYLQICREAAQRGYFIRVYFLYLSNRNLNIKRVQQRVLMGGHNVPKKDIIRRFRRSFENFWNLYRPLANDWILVNNTLSKPMFTLEKSQFDSLDAKTKENISRHFVKGKILYEKK